VLAWSLAGLFGLISAATTPVAMIHFRQRPPAPAAPVRFQILRPEPTTPGLAEFAVSPDGRRLVYATAGSDGIRRLWLRNLDSLETQPLPGTETGSVTIPFWSADSRYVAFTAAGKLKRFDVGGPAGQGSVQTICDLPGGQQIAAGSWNRAGVIVFGGLGGGIMRVSAAGGVPSALTTVSDNERHLLPTLLPDGKHFLYLRSSQRSALTSGVYMGSLDTKPEQQDSRLLLASGIAAVYVPSENPDIGQVLFLREGTLFAQPFDLLIPGLTGEPLPITGGVARVGVWGAFSASENGVLVYVSGESQAGETAGLNQATWFDRHGKVAGVEQLNFLSGELSPDGTRVVY
jgi:eukaryotic-like serine/threonine-protein kinase